MADKRDRGSRHSPLPADVSGSAGWFRQIIGGIRAGMLPAAAEGEVVPATLLLPRWLILLRPYLISAVVLWFVVCLAIWYRGIAIQIDISVYRSGGLAVLHGLPLYEGNPAPAGLPFTYPPFAAIIFTPLALFTEGGTKIFFTAANLLLLLFAVSRCWYWLGYRRERTVSSVVILLTVLAAMFEPVHTTLYLGQINIVLLALVLWDLLRVKDSRWMGIGVGIAAGIKLTPLIFIPYLLLTKRFRAAAVATTTFIGTIAVGFLITPVDARAYWLGRKFADSSRVGEVWSTNNQSLRGMLARLVSPPDATQFIWQILAILAAIIGVSAAVLAYRRGSDLLGISLMGLSSTMVSPFSWPHHWVWFVPLAVFFVQQALTKGGWVYWTMTAYVFISAFAWPTTWPAADSSSEGPNTGIWSIDWAGQAVTRNEYLIVFLVSVIFTIVHFRRPAEKTTLGKDFLADQPREANLIS